MANSISSVPFDFTECNKAQMSPTHVAMFYPQLGYDLHPLLMNQRKRTESMNEKFNSQTLVTNDDFSLSAHHLVINSPKAKNKQKSFRCAKKPPMVVDYMDSSTTPAPMLPLSSPGALPCQPSMPLAVEKHRKIFYCRECGKSFKFQTSLLRHNNKVHNCKYQCPTCHRVFSRQAYLDVHISKPGSSCYLNCYNVRTSNAKPKN